MEGGGEWEGEGEGSGGCSGRDVWEENGSGVGGKGRERERGEMGWRGEGNSLLGLLRIAWIAY